MKKTIFIALLFIVENIYAQNNAEQNFSFALKDDWKMQSSLNISAKGEDISQQNFSPTGWYTLSVPTTIIAGLLVNKVYDFDPFFAKNLEKISGPQFDKPWWFRKEFTLPASEKDRNIIIQIHGINYKANIWLNGVLIADTTTVRGPFRIFEFDITKQIKYNAANVLAIEVMRPVNPQKKDGDLAIDYADWIHYPADYNGGIVNDVTINTCDKVAIRHPLVTTKFDLPSLAVAHLQVDADVINYSKEETDVIVKGKINDDVNFEQKLHLMPLETKAISFMPEAYAQLNVRTPRIWWPWQYGKPELNRIELEVIRNNKVSNAIKENFGIRQITSKLINNCPRHEHEYYSFRRKIRG